VNEPPFDFFLEIENRVRKVVREELSNALANGAVSGPESEKLLTPEQAAALMGVKKDFLYRHKTQLAPFTRRLSRKAIRFTEAGVRR